MTPICQGAALGVFYLDALMETISHENLRDQISALDRRVLILETEILGVKSDVKANHALAEKIGNKVDDLNTSVAIIVAETKSTKSWLVIGLGAFGGFMAILEYVLKV